MTAADVDQARLRPAREVAKDLGISYRTLHRRAEAGQFPLYRALGREVLVDPDQVREALQPRAVLFPQRTT